MSVDVMSTFFALLALGANVVVLTAIATSVVPALRPVRGRLADGVRGSTLVLAAVVTGVATAGSLYYSEVAGFPPCRLCWIQRGFMYPLFPALTLTAWRGAWPLRPWARLAALLGAAVSVWHLLVERFPGLEGAIACDAANPCSLVWVKEFGFITIPYMAFAAFTLVAVLLSVRPDSPTDARACDASDEPSTSKARTA